MRTSSVISLSRVVCSGEERDSGSDSLTAADATCLLGWGSAPSVRADESSSSKPLASVTVGIPKTINDLILPGSELIARPIEGDPAIIVQVVDTFRHGDSFRYTIRFSGLEPGEHDLADWLVRKDDSPTGQLPKIPIEIESLLPAGQVTPNALPDGWLPQMGGYKMVMIAAACLWGLVLLALVFGGRRKKIVAQRSEAQKRSLADLLQERLEAAFNNKVAPQQYAELERMLFSWWRKRLGYDSLAPEVALTKIKQNAQAGPLMIQLERWMHRPERDNQDVDLAKLLEPYRELPVDQWEAGR